MRLRKLLYLIPVLVSVWVNVKAQDIHFTQYNMSPMTLNPANTGRFEGTARVGGIYRGQWASVIGQKFSYKTPSVWVDAPIITGFRRQDWVGVGLMFFTDKSSSGGLKHTAAKLGAAYHLGLDKRGNSVLTLGFQWGQANRSIADINGYKFYDGYINSAVPGDYGQTQEFGNGTQLEPKANFSDIDAGVVFSSKLNKNMDFSLGFSMFHIGQGNYSLVSASGGGGGGGTGTAEISQRFIGTGQFNIKLNDRFTVSPSFLYQTMAGNDEIMLQAMGGYLFNVEKDITLTFGLGYRLRDAAHPMVGFKKGPLTVGFAYDVNVSSLTNASRYRGGFELAANYLIKIYKPAVLKPKVLCPRF